MSTQTSTFNDFLHSEKSSGVWILFCTLISMAIANWMIGDRDSHGYRHRFWARHFGRLSQWKASWRSSFYIHCSHARTVSTSTRFELENTFLALYYWLILDSPCRFSTPTSHTQTTVKWSQLPRLRHCLHHSQLALLGFYGSDDWLNTALHVDHWGPKLVKLNALINQHAYLDFAFGINLLYVHRWVHMRQNTHWSLDFLSSNCPSTHKLVEVICPLWSSKKGFVFPRSDHPTGLSSGSVPVWPPCHFCRQSMWCNWCQKPPSQVQHWPIHKKRCPKISQWSKNFFSFLVSEMVVVVRQNQLQIGSYNQNHSVYFVSPLASDWWDLAYEML